LQLFGCALGRVSANYENPAIFAISRIAARDCRPCPNRKRTCSRFLLPRAAQRSIPRPRSPATPANRASDQPARCSSMRLS
jgi:hypothetical protein